MAAVTVQNYKVEFVFVAVFLSFLIKISHQVTNQLDSDIQALGTSLPGCYSNVKQYYAHATGRFPPSRRSFLLRAEFYKMEEPLFNDSLTVYFQHYTKSSRKPFGLGFYSFVADKKMKVIKMRIYKFKLGVFEIKKPLHNYIIPSDSISGQVLKKRSQNKRLLTHSSCDMYWTKLSDLRFIGITGSQCLASLGKSNIRISVSMTVAGSKLKLTEGWYNVKDGTRLTQVNVPYLLAKTPHFPKPKVKKAKKNRKKLARISQDKMFDTLDIREYGNAEAPEEKIKWRDEEITPVARKLPVIIPPISFKENKSYTRSKVRNFKKKAKKCKERKSKKHRFLRNFRQVMVALTSGHDVNFHVDLNECTQPDQFRIDRYSFGGKITDFLYIKDSHSTKRKDRVYFSTMKTVMGYEGMEFITREITVMRGNRVEVKVKKDYTDPSTVPLKYTFNCRLYNERKGKGSVRISSNPSANVKKVSFLKKMTTSLTQGRDLRLVADMSRCQGSRPNTHIVIGSSITDFDIVNDGKTMEVFIPVDQAVSPNFRNGRRNGYVGQIFDGGDVVLTWVSGRKEDGFQAALSMGSAYYCRMSSRNQVSTNQNDGSGVSIYYTK